MQVSKSVIATCLEPSSFGGDKSKLTGSSTAGDSLRDRPVPCRSLAWIISGDSAAAMLVGRRSTVRHRWRNASKRREVD